MSRSALAGAGAAGLERGHAAGAGAGGGPRGGARQELVRAARALSAARSDGLRFLGGQLLGQPDSLAGAGL